MEQSRDTFRSGELTGCVVHAGTYLVDCVVGYLAEVMCSCAVGVLLLYDGCVSMITARTCQLVGGVGVQVPGLLLLLVLCRAPGSALLAYSGLPDVRR